MSFKSYYQSKSSQMDWVDWGQLHCVKNKGCFIFILCMVKYEWAFNYFLHLLRTFFLKSTAKSGKYFSVNSHLKCQLFQVFSSVAKLNLFLLNSICFTWLNLLSPQFWGSYSRNLPTLSLLPYFMLSLVGIFKHNSGTQMALKINGTWLPNHTKFSASSTISVCPTCCVLLYEIVPLSAMWWICCLLPSLWVDLSLAPLL